MKKALLAAIGAMFVASSVYAAPPVIDGLNTDASYTRFANQTTSGSFGQDLQLYNGSFTQAGGNLYIHLGGALRTGGATTGLWFFLDTNNNVTITTVTATNGTAEGFILGQNGVLMENGFSPDYFFGWHNSAGTPNVYQCYFYDLGVAQAQTNFGSFDATAGTFTASGTPIAGLAAKCNNTAPLDGSAVASAVTTGYELQIPLSAIGNPAVPGNIRIMVGAGDGGNGYYSNQTLATSNAATSSQIGGGNGNNPKPDFQNNIIGAFGGGTFSGTQTVTLALTVPAGVDDWNVY